MKFTDLQLIMAKRGINSLAKIARALKTTPQAVSNWKSRDQVPYHIVNKLNKTNVVEDNSFSQSSSVYEEEVVSLSDILITMSEQLKVIILVPFVIVFLTFTYVQFIQPPKYSSWATILLPQNKAGSLGGLSGLVSSFGVNMPPVAEADLSSPSIIPELLRSRTFAETILDKRFYIEKYQKELSLLNILTYGDKLTTIGRDTLVSQAVVVLNSEYLEFNQNPKSTFSVLKVTAPEPVFAKELADVVVAELETLNRYFKSQTVSDKISFIENRIASVEDDLELSEKRLKEFNEQNRQISSPALQLELDRQTRDVEVQKGIYLTLKQQLELIKIEEIQGSSIIQILDEPVIPLGSSNKNLRLSVVISAIIGLGLGIMLGFVRSYTNNADMEERKKLRRVKNFIKKKGKDLLVDYRVSGIVSICLIIGLPFYLGHKSQNPVFFNMYSPKLMIVITVYLLTLLSSLVLFFYSKRKS